MKVTKVTFTKVSGEKREMICTKDFSDEDFVKKYGNVFTEGAKERKKSDEVEVVWDLENDGFRSYRLDSVISKEEVKGFNIFG